MTIRLGAEVLLIAGLGWLLVLPDSHAAMARVEAMAVTGGGTDWCKKQTNCNKDCARTGTTLLCEGCASDGDYQACFQEGSGTTCSETNDNGNPLYCGDKTHAYFEPFNGKCWHLDSSGQLVEGCGPIDDPCLQKPNTVTGQSCNQG